MRKGKILGIAVACTTIAASVAASTAGPAGASGSSPSTATATDYVVLYKAGAIAADARAAIAKAGGTIVREHTKLGYAFVRSSDAKFVATVNTSSAVDGAARNRVIGHSPKTVRAHSDALERLTKERAASRGQLGATDAGVSAAAEGEVTPEPLANRQWDMRQIGATAQGSYAVDQGSKGVLVGIIDTGIDGQHPDIAPNFNAALSHNFVTDIESVDGPCEFAGCVDPANWDDNGHGTHVASTIGSPVNGLGIAGVAPGVTLVNLRAGQDSGYFFLQPTLEAMEYAGDIGVDVINMSYFTDPWLFNCVDNPADSPAEQTEQRVIRRATQRAINYAIDHNVLPVAAEGNEATDLGHPTSDDTSPDFPPGTEKHRDVDNSCITVPTETKGVVAVSSTGPSTRKAYYSNYGLEQTDVAAPGGDAYDSPDETLDVRNLVLAAYPRHIAREFGDVDDKGRPTTPFVVRSCHDGQCGYYQYLQGTSMASPHAVGVAALLVSNLGHSDADHGGLTLEASTTQAKLYETAVPHACPEPRLFHYHRIRPDGSIGEADHFCAGPIEKNGFYGHGIVNAYLAATTG